MNGSIIGWLCRPGFPHNSVAVRRNAARLTAVLFVLCATGAVVSCAAEPQLAAPTRGPVAAPLNLYVDAATGDDRATGLAPQSDGADGPLRTLRPAIRRARPGDTIHLVPGKEPVRDIAVFHDVHGEPERPITLDGHGTTLTGTEPLDPANGTKWRRACIAATTCCQRNC